MGDLSDAIDQLKKSVTGPLIAGAIKLLVDAISPQLKQIIVSSLTQWQEKAKDTANPWDDLLCRLLLAIFR